MLGKLFSFVVGGGVKAVSDAITPFTGDKVQDEDNRHDEAVGRLAQFTAEFADRSNRTWWDSFIDGLNRLPRPAMALGVIGLFVWASADPVRFAASAQAWALIPDEMWIVLGAIITFFFGDRTLLGMRKGKGPTPDQVKAVLDTQRSIANMLPAMPPPPDDATPRVADTRYRAEMGDNAKPLSNAVIEEWNRRRKQGG
ncbi:3TM-type holin [Niveispirillum sp. KHB5.9]|uniref:3TM-type holin n=1 Tax=Niveispirillum sp. KHB5.9 TaxID=3400269 RepID=UPI003A8B5A5B